MARYAYVNGRYVDHREASVHIEDRGYQLADGVYEGSGVRDGKLIDEGPHIDRLDRSLRELRIAWPVSRADAGLHHPRTDAPQPPARRPGLYAGDARRGPARPRLPDDARQAGAGADDQEHQAGGSRPGPASR